MIKDICSRCKWVNKIDDKHWICPFSQCIEYIFKTQSEQVEKRCATCRKQKKCKRAEIVFGCELYSPSDEAFAIRRCYLCGSTYHLHEHHAIGGPNRKRSDREGLTFDLCAQCHTQGRHAVHNDEEVSRKLKKIAQAAYEEAYGEGSFLRDFGRNYL